MIWRETETFSSPTAYREFRCKYPQGAKLFEQKRCYICHETEKVSLGPPLKAIAVRHKARREVMAEVLARKIVHGGGGSWGVVPMVPNQWVSLEEARAMADWILGL